MEEGCVEGGLCSKIFLERTRKGHRQWDQLWKCLQGSVGDTYEILGGAHKIMGFLQCITCTRKSPYAPHPVFRKFPQRCLFMYHLIVYLSCYVPSCYVPALLCTSLLCICLVNFPNAALLCTILLCTCLVVYHLIMYLPCCVPSYYVPALLCTILLCICLVMYQFVMYLPCYVPSWAELSEKLNFNASWTSR